MSQSERTTLNVSILCPVYFLLCVRGVIDIPLLSDLHGTKLSQIIELPVLNNIIVARWSDYHDRFPNIKMGISPGTKKKQQQQQQ